MILVVNLILMGFPIQSLANDQKGIFFSYTSAKSLLIDYKYYKENLDVTQKKLYLTEQQNTVLDKYNKDMKIEIDKLRLDKKELSEVSDDYKNKLGIVNNELIKIKEGIPSRVTWFGYGFMSMAILGIIGLFAIK